MILTALCLVLTGILMLRHNRGEDTMHFLIRFFSSAILLVGMAAGRLAGRILDKAKP